MPGEEGLTQEEINALFPKKKYTGRKIAVIAFLAVITALCIFLYLRWKTELRGIEAAEERFRLVERELDVYQTSMERALLAQKLEDYAGVKEILYSTETNIKALREFVYGSTESIPYDDKEVWERWEKSAK